MTQKVKMNIVIDTLALMLATGTNIERMTAGNVVRVFTVETVTETKVAAKTKVEAEVEAGTGEEMHTPLLRPLLVVDLQNIVTESILEVAGNIWGFKNVEQKPFISWSFSS